MFGGELDLVGGELDLVGGELDLVGGELDLVGGELDLVGGELDQVQSKWGWTRWGELVMGRNRYKSLWLWKTERYRSLQSVCPVDRSVISTDLNFLLY